MMETGLFEIQAEQLRGYRQARQLLPHSRDVNNPDILPGFAMTFDSPAIEFARCFLRLATLPNFALDRLS